MGDVRPLRVRGLPRPGWLSGPALDLAADPTLNDWPQPIDLVGANVTAALQAAFDALFGDATGVPLTIGIFYGYEVVPPAQPGGPGLTTYLPVGLYPNQSLSSSTAGNIANALVVRWSANTPSSTNGEWAVSLTLYSQVETSRQRLLLTLGRLVYKLT